MPKARKLQIALEATAWYHVISRCVRRAFLCGQDQFTGRSFEHRRQWIENDLESLSSVFFIDIAAFAILSNHYHLVLHVNQTAAEKADMRDIIERWHRCFAGVDWFTPEFGHSWRRLQAKRLPRAGGLDRAANQR